MKSKYQIFIHNNKNKENPFEKYLETLASNNFLRNPRTYITKDIITPKKFMVYKFRLHIYLFCFVFFILSNTILFTIRQTKEKKIFMLSFLGFSLVFYFSIFFLFWRNFFKPHKSNIFSSFLKFPNFKSSFTTRQTLYDFLLIFFY